MKLLYLVPIFLLLNNIVRCQQESFEYLYANSDDLYFFDLAETDEGEILFCGGFSKIEDPNTVNSYIVKLSRDGFFIDSCYSVHPNSSSFNNSIISFDNEIVILESQFENNYLKKEVKLVLYRMDNELDLHDTTIYHFPPNYKFVNASASAEKDGKILIGGAFYNESNVWRPFLYSLTYQFDSIIAKYYTDKLGSTWKMKSLSKNNYWIIISGPDNYYKLDSSLSILESSKIPNYLHGNIGVKWDTDSSFYLVGDDLISEPAHNLGFIRQFHPINTSGHIFNHWGISDTIDLPAVTNGIDFKNRDTIFIGGTRNIDIHYPFYNDIPSWFVILQTDSMLNIRWERFYGGDAYYLMGKLIATRDGGCLIGGTRYDYQNVSELQNDVIIVKLNSEGLLVGNTETPNIEMHEAIVYPNPGTTEIKVRIAAQYQESLFQLFDMSGIQVAGEKIVGKWGSINSSFLQAGTYIYRVSSKDGLFETGKWVKQ